MSNSVALATLEQGVPSQDITVLSHAIKNIYGNDRATNSSKNWFSFFSVSISFENKPEVSHTNYIFIDSRFPLEQSDGSVYEEIKRYTEYEYYIDKRIKTQMRKTQKIKNIIETASNSKVFLQKCWMDNRKAQADAANNGVEFNETLLTLEPESAKEHNLEKWLSGSIEFLLSEKGDKIKKIEIEIKRPLEYKYCFKDDEIAKYFTKPIMNGDLYKILKLRTYNEQLESGGSSLILDTLANAFDGMVNALCDSEWVKDALKPESVTNKTNNKKAVGLMLFELWLAGDIFTGFFNYTRANDIKVYAGDVEDSIDLNSSSVGNYMGKPITTVLSSPVIEGCCLNHLHCFLFDPLLGAYTFSLISGLKEQARAFESNSSGMRSLDGWQERNKKARKDKMRHKTYLFIYRWFIFSILMFAVLFIAIIILYCK